MRFYTGFEYLLIDLASAYGLSKQSFEERIQWALSNFEKLEEFTATVKAKNRPLYHKALLAIHKSIRGETTGHLVGLDACCSGVQIMSAMSGCIDGAEATGLVDTSKPADAYTKITETIEDEIYESISIDRDDAKEATMTAFYGSKAVPKRIFGGKANMLEAFYVATEKVAPGAWYLLQDLLNSWTWNPTHDWIMPDGYEVHIKVMNKKKVRIEVDELNHSTFTYEYYENEGMPTGLSNAANVVHSVDAYVLRCMHRRCNYDLKQVKDAVYLIEAEIKARKLSAKEYIKDTELSEKMGYYLHNYKQSELVDIAALPYIDWRSLKHFSKKYLTKMLRMLNDMLKYEPFELVTIHDEFKAHANNMNWVRWNYKEILADIADSNITSDLLSQVYKQPIHSPKRSVGLGSIIRESAYALT